MEHPEEIYKDFNGKELSEPERLWGEGINRRRSYDLGHEAGYAKCLADRSDPLAGFSNLTDAISAGETIDWERLDGLKVQCVNPNLGTLRGELERRGSAESDSPNGWWRSGMDYIYVNALTHAWSGEDGWTLWLEGDIPLVRKTADELEVGTYFRGEIPGYMEGEAYVGGEEFGIGKRVHRAPSMIESITPASEWVVLEEYGPFQKPEGK